MMVAVIRTVERENVVEWGAADGVISSSHSQSYPAVVVDALAVVADRGALVAGAGRGRRRRCDEGRGRVRRRVGDGGAGGDGGRPGRGGGGHDGRAGRGAGDAAQSGKLMMVPYAWSSAVRSRDLLKVGPGLGGASGY
jgi:hypothetical protein